MANIDDQPADENAKTDTPNKPDTGTGGEDDSSTEIEGDDSHLHDDQKSRRMSSI